MSELTTAQLLELERAHPRWNRAKHDAVRALGIPEAVYAQTLHRTVHTREALQHDAQLAHQLTDRYQARARNRAALIRRRTR